MALKLTVESFLQVVRQSGLIDKDQLQKLLQQFEARGVDVSKSQSIADALVGDEIITRWQADKLLAGKHKGFSLGKYKLLDLLGKGGMSSVYLAEHVLMKRRCAIKVLPGKRVHDSSYLARFHREAQAVASVDHPNIVRAYDVDHAQDRDSQIHFLVMEYVSGQSLQELIVRNGPANYADAVEYIRQSAEGLEHAHRAGLVHRDIKPANLLIDTNGTIKILDMGLARFFDDRDENPLTVAHDEKVLGTADYLAPEQALDSHTADARADIYSLGCSLHFLLTGNPPFTEGTLTQRLMWHQTKSFPPLTDSRIDCPVSLSALLAKMVEKKPEDRFQSAAEVATACHQWLADNAGVDWKQLHVPVARGSSPNIRVIPLSRDLQSDPAILKSASHVMGSSLESLDEEVTSATKISRPGNVSVPPPSTLPIPPVLQSSSVSAPLGAPPVAAVVSPPAPEPIAPPIAQPVVVPPPVARPVLPVAMPIAVPVAATLVAQPVKVAAPVVIPAESTTAPAVALVETTEVVPNFLFGDSAASEETIVTATEAPTETPVAVDIFSLFSGGEEAPVEQPESNLFTVPAEPTANESQPTETVVIESPMPAAIAAEPESAEFSFESVRPETRKPERIAAAPKKSASLLGDKFKKPAARYAALAAGAVIVIGSIAWWSTRGSGETGKTVAKNTKKDKGGKSLTTGGTKKSDAHEVTMLVGAGGEFKSIGRAIYSAVESRAEHEKAANGKPLRFVISVQPGQTLEEAIMFDESFPGEVHLTSNTPGKRFTLTSPSLTEPAITIKNRSGVTIENVEIDLVGFPQKEKGIVVTGSVERCLIRNCVISDAGKAGIELNGAVGGEGADAIVLDGIICQKASPTSSGVHVTKSSNGTPTQRVIVQRCKFFGSMSSGVFFEGPVESFTVRNCGATGPTSGIRFAGGVVAKKVVIDHCSFRNHAEAGLLFDAMPGDGTGDLVWRNCLFAGIGKAELLIAKTYDANKFNSLMSADKTVENNWSDRKTAKSVNGEHDLLGNGGARVAAIQFEATGVSQDMFLVPKASEPYKTAGIKPK